MEAKSVEESAINDYVYKIFPNVLNPNGTVFGGLLMAQADRLAAIVAERHAGAMVLTASVDAIHFRAPVYQGEIICMKGAINQAWNSSMEVGLRISTLPTGKTGGEERHILTAYFTMVAVTKDNKPQKVPSLIIETEEQRARSEAAERRRRLRIKMAAEEK